MDYEKVDLRNQITASGHCFNRINPKGDVPALSLSSGEMLTDVSVVVRFLADQAPHSGLMPERGSTDRSRVQEWLDFIGTELDVGFAPLWKPATSAERQGCLDNLHRLFRYLDGHLEERLYLMGDRFTVADAYNFTVLSWSYFHKVELSAYPHLLSYIKRIAARPKVREALGAEGLKVPV
jgi:glutathione S-transferase